MKNRNKIVCILLAVILCAGIWTDYSSTNTGLYLNAATESSKSGKDVTKTFKDKKKVAQLLQNAIQWVGMKTLFQKKDYSSLSDISKLEMASLNCQIVYENNLPIVEKSEFDKQYKRLFGTGPNLDKMPKYKESSNQIVSIKSGNIIPMLGDWGEGYPVFKITKIYQKSASNYVVKCNNYLSYYDSESNSRVDDKIGESTFSIKKGKDYTYGYVIKDLSTRCIK